MRGKTILQGTDGWYIEYDDGITLAGPYDTNAEAWRALDRLNGEPINRREQVSDWIASKG
jgi:hypothetical protein